jgi:hypothetical protein
MDYAEATYFDGYHFSHIAAWQEQHRLTRLRNGVDRRRCRR